MLNPEQVKTLAAHDLITIGAHTVNHPSLRQLSDKNLRFELEESKRRLEEVTGGSVKNFAYPVGEITDASYREFEVVKECGYESAVTTRFAHWQPEHKNMRFALPRITASRMDTLSSFARKVSGVEAMFAQRGKRVISN